MRPPNYTIKFKTFEVLIHKEPHTSVLVLFKTLVIPTKSGRSRSAIYTQFTLAPDSNYRKLMTFLFVKAEVFEEISSFKCQALTRASSSTKEDAAAVAEDASALVLEKGFSLTRLELTCGARSHLFSWLFL